jgi:hypothetical protein
VINYPTYDKELYALVQSVKKWNHYLMGKGDNNSYRSSTITIFSITDQARIVTTLQVDGFSIEVSSGNQV